ncbi:hypothetical protein [Elizabethkingia anophelis]|uniref:hypothetical protein n=1 Tax=Elizabethkingia anophelis TaxID=1117645 RepID=UPI0023E94F99|nr:hypothetical protein [Elizabethkingia anophelis]GJN60461.1 hypothetical protein ELAK_06110 [Elizabethkingia anophelis]HDP3254011.1 hypothetical protein [Elizabethkingia anophelis]
MKRLEELFAEMTREIPFVVNEELKPYILELAQVYAREVAQASLEKAAENAKTSDNCKVWNCEGQSVNIETIVNPDNIVLL